MTQLFSEYTSSLVQQISKDEWNFDFNNMPNILRDGLNPDFFSFFWQHFQQVFC